jgi:hypothetical protein
MTKAEMQAEIERLTAKCDKQAMMLRRLFPERHPDTLFICGEGGERDGDGLPAILFVCPAYGCDFSTAYERTERGIHPQW